MSINPLKYDINEVKIFNTIEETENSEILNKTKKSTTPVFSYLNEKLGYLSNKLLNFTISTSKSFFNFLFFPLRTCTGQIDKFERFEKLILEDVWDTIESKEFDKKWDNLKPQEKSLFLRALKAISSREFPPFVRNFPAHIPEIVKTLTKENLKILIHTMHNDCETNYLNESVKKMTQEQLIDFLKALTHIPDYEGELPFHLMESFPTNPEIVSSLSIEQLHFLLEYNAFNKTAAALNHEDKLAFVEALKQIPGYNGELPEVIEHDYDPAIISVDELLKRDNEEFAKLGLEGIMDDDLGWISD